MNFTEKQAQFFSLSLQGELLRKKDRLQDMHFLAVETPCLASSVKSQTSHEQKHLIDDDQPTRQKRFNSHQKLHVALLKHKHCLGYHVIKKKCLH